MSEHMFGLGRGWLSAKAAKIARTHGAQLINHTDPQCKCGYGCSPFNCKRSRRHWFVCQNLGAPFDQDKEREVYAALAAAGIRGAA